MTYPNNPQFLAWWNAGAHVRQTRLEPGYPGNDPDTDSVLQDLATHPNYAPHPSSQQSGATPFDANDTD